MKTYKEELSKNLMETIKEAFQRIQENLNLLNNELNLIKSDLSYLKSLLQKSSYNQAPSISTQNPSVSTQNPSNPTDNWLFKALKAQKQPISMGNRGVPTDRQTNQQTDNSSRNTLNETSFLLESLDSLKQEFRSKLKKLTEKEILTFVTLYQLEEQGYSVNYKLLSEKLSLTESSIRDYIRRLLFKGIPIEKIKQNNKEIYLSISPNLKRIASLNAILQLREL